MLYMVGGFFFFMSVLYLNLQGGSPGLWCAPDETHLVDYVVVAVTYMRDKSDALHEPAVALMSNALYKAFPCK